MARRGLTRWVMITSLVIVALVAGAGVAVAVTESQLQDTRDRRDSLVEAGRVEASLLTAYVDEETGLRGYLLTGEPTFLAPFDRAAERIPTLSRSLRATFLAVGGPTVLVDQLERAHEAWFDHASTQIDAVAAGRAPEAVSVAATGRGKQLFDAIRSRDGAVADWLAQEAAQAARQLTALQARLTALLSGTLTVFLLVTVASCLVLWKAVARPLDRLTRATRAVAAGDLAASLPATGAAEVRSLAADVAEMRDRLAADLFSTRRALQALDQAGPAVSALRAALEPAGERVPGIHLAARLDPAEGVLAGDWYDTLALAPARLGLVLGDVAGHGPASAVFALRLKHSLLTALRTGMAPGRAMTEVCAQLTETPGGQFATAFVAVVDTAAGTVAFANAGHPGALVLRGSPPGAAARPDAPPDAIELAPTGPLLSSVMVGRTWGTGTAAFVVGDLLLAYTDGVTETRDGAGVEFGTDGILAAATAVGTADTVRLVEAIAAASMRYGGGRPRRDDHTLVCLQRI